MSRKQFMLQRIKFWEQKLRKEKRQLPLYLEASLFMYLEQLSYVDSLEEYVQMLRDIKNNKY